jgi:glycosyltransferase involved in cell wall biosynthesis
MPFVSLIIPTRNCRAELSRLLASIERQTFRDLEVIVVDNFSTDGTFEMASPRAIAFQLGPERHAQRAAGAARARGEYLMFFDADMELDAGLVEECVALGRQGFDAVILPERGGGSGYWAECQKLEKECYWEDPWMEAANRFIRTETYRKVGGYRTDLIAGEDFDLHDRLVAAGARIGRCRAMITHHEGTAFWGVVRKKFYYGGKLGTVLREAPVKNAKRFVVFKPAYFRNRRLLVRHPLLTLGLITMKTAQFLAGALGLAISCFRLQGGRGDIACLSLTFAGGKGSRCVRPPS